MAKVILRLKEGDPLTSRQFFGVPGTVTHEPKEFSLPADIVSSLREKGYVVEEETAAVHLPKKKEK